MRRYVSLLVALLVVGVAFAAGCGGGSKTVNIPGGGQVSSSNKVPDTFPGDFPTYSGANVKGSVSGQNQGGISGTSVIWETGDGLDKVKSFFDGEFAKDNWKAESNGEAGGTAFWSGKSKDGKKVFYAGATNANGKTTITVVVGDNQDTSSGGGSKTSTSGSSSSGNKTATASSSDSSSGGGDKSPTASPLPPEVKLPTDFPKDRVPLPSGARVTSSSSFGQGGQKTYILTVYTKGTPQDASDYFSKEMPNHNWTEAFNSNTNGEFFATYSSGDTSSGSGDTLTVTASTSDTSGYAQVAISVTLAAAP